ncbi:MAG: hypothetical protein ACWGN7_03785 [Thermodesulfovibrionales bacterium]
MNTIRGKSCKAVALDVAEGYASVNPLFLKPLDHDTLKEFYGELLKAQNTIRGEKFQQGDIEAIRWRNLRLQRLYNASMVLKHFARERRIHIV